MKYAIIALIGSLAAILANRGIAVFNDGFRPLLPQYFDRVIDRRELAAMSLAISFGLVVGYGIPASIAASVILIHCLLLSADLIGIWCSDSKGGLILAGLGGGAYALALMAGLEAVTEFFATLPYNFLESLGHVSDYIVAATTIIPGIALGLQHGVKRGAFAVGVIMLTFLLFRKIGRVSLFDHEVLFNPAGMAMLAGILLMLMAAARQRGEGNSHASLAAAFSSRLVRIGGNVPLLVLMGGLVSAGASLGIVAGDPASLALISQDEYFGAALAAFARAIGFAPLIFTTAIVTGVYAPAGCTFVFVVGLICHGQTAAAFLAGGAVIWLEISLLKFSARGMDKFPGIKEMGEHIRTAMNRVVEIALVVGSMVAAESMGIEAANLTGAGTLFVIAAILLNREAEGGIVEMAVGPMACIVWGILLNLFIVTGLV